MFTQNAVRFVEELLGRNRRSSKARKSAWKARLKTTLRIEGLELREMMSAGSPLANAAAMVPVSITRATDAMQASGFVQAAATAKPNLTPYKPSSWSGNIVVSNRTGTNTDNSPLTTNDNLYIDWAVVNNGTAAVQKSFQTSLYVDGKVKATWTVNPTLNANYYVYALDYSLGKLSAGQHTLQIKADVTNTVAETNENDNLATKTISISAASSNYMLTTAWGGNWCDADKSTPNTEDDLLCWAATTSNMLKWTGWGNVGGMSTTDQIFKYFQNHWTDQGGHVYYGADWWFDGSNNMQGASGWAQVDVTGGRFFPSQSFANYVRYSGDATQSLNTINSYLHSGCAVGLGLGGPGGHAVTCWGYEYASGNSSSYKGVYITDSDDNQSAPSSDYLKYYTVVQSGSRWYLQNFYGSNSWYISDVTGLNRRPANTMAAAGTAQSPSTSVPVLPVGAAAAVAAATDEALRAGIVPPLANASGAIAESKSVALPAVAAAPIAAPQAPAGLSEETLRYRDLLVGLEAERANKAADRLEQDLVVVADFSAKAVDAVLSTSV